MSGLDIEGVLAGHPGWHRVDDDEHGDQRIECLGLKCRERFALRYYGDAPEVHRAHVAAVLREQIAAWLDSEEVLGTVWKVSGLGMGRAEQVTVALAAQVAPPRVPGEET